MTKFTELPLIDRLVMGISGALILLGTVVLGIVELAAGRLAPMYYGYVEGEFGQEMVVALSESGLPDGATGVVAPIVHPNIRAGLVVLGLFILLVYSLYVVAARRGTTATAEPRTSSTAD